MRGAALIETQRLMAQSIGALADHVEQATGYQLTPVKYADLPNPQTGMIACINDSPVANWGQVITGGVGVGAPPGTAYTVLAFFDGTNWVVH